VELQVDGAHIHYRRSGAGFPVVFLHAGVADSRMWEPQVAGLSDYFDVITPDMRGFGESEPPSHAWSPTADILALMDALGLRDAPHLVGCSIGGRTAIDFTLEHPDRVSKLVLVGAGVSGQENGDENDSLYAEIIAAEKAKDLDAMNVAEMKLWLVGPGRSVTHVDQRLRDLFLDMNGRALQNYSANAPMKKGEPPAVGRLGEIKAPTLVIVGDHDLPDIQKTADLLASTISGARKVLVQDAAHLPNLEHPKEFNRLLLDFLNG
jgi:pimeloyl-ACP methyl ester carboxylesterase